MQTKSHFFISAMVFSAISLGNAGSTLYLPAMPVIAAHLGTNGAMMKLSLSLFLIGFAIAQVIYGPLSDALGRRINLLIGLVIFFIGSLISANAPGIDMLLIGRLMEGLGIGAANAVGYALLRDVYSGPQLTLQLGYMSLFVGVTPLVAPIIGGYLVSFIDWQACFYFLAIAAMILFIVKWHYLPETLALMDARACHPAVISKNFATLFKSKTYIGYAFATACAFSAVFTTGSMLPFLLVNQLHISVSIYGWIAGIPALGYMAGSFIGGKLAQTLELGKIIVVGVSIQLIALAVGIGINMNYFNAYSLIAPLLVFMIGVGLVMPSGSSGAMAPFPKLAGSEAALLCASMFCFASFFTAIGSHLSESNPVSLFFLLMSMSLLTLLFLWIAKKGD